jgi:hypothetical protein
MENSENKIDNRIEQYKSYMENLNAIGNQHSLTRGFYVSIISALLVFLSFLCSKDLTMQKIGIPGLYAVSLLGIILCIIWCIHTCSYGRLFKAKFIMLKKLEEGFTFHIFAEEWEILEKLKFKRLTKIEEFVSLILSLPFIIFLLLLSL